LKPPDEEPSDEELVEICNRGGHEAAARAFEALYRRHRDYVLRISMRFVRDRELAHDALQETFTYLLRKFPPSGPGLVLTARLQTFLYPVAKHCAISARRKAGRDVGGQSAEWLDELPAEADAPADAALIDAALAGLSAERREVLVLRLIDDLSLAEIAAALGVPLGTVKSRLHIALKQLRENPHIKDLFDP
jgi:RNA polymerase sigma-70 factor, ECF subfamily